MKHFYATGISWLLQVTRSRSLTKVIVSLLFIVIAVSTYAADYYWIGGSGKWSDKQHWATTSGGQGGSGQIPTLNDNVFFDRVSGVPADSNHIIIDIPAFCNSIRWNEMQVAPRLIVNADFLIDSAITFQPGMLISGNNATISFTNSTKTKVMVGASNVIVLWDNGFWFNGWPFPPPPPGDKKPQ